jgi:glutamate synthase (NADPH/NADH) large chain
LVDAAAEEIQAIDEFLERYGIPFKGKFKKVVSAGNDLTYPTPEPSTTRISYPVFSSADSSYWNEKIQQDLRIKSKIGRYRIRGYGTTRHLPHFNDLAFKGYCRGIDKRQDISSVNLRTLIGDRHGARAIDLSMPVMIAPMSYGAH